MSAFLTALLLAQATIYTWTDSAGVEHFTDDVNTVPKGVQVRTTAGAEVSRIDGEVKPVRPLAAPKVQPAAPQPGMPSASEQYWRQAFKDARRKIASLEDDIEIDRKEIEEVNGLPMTARMGCMPAAWPQPVGAVTTGSVVVSGQPAPGWNVTTSVGGQTVVMPGGFVPYPGVCFANPEFERRRERLTRSRRELVRAKEDLADLERRASFEAVPLEWRR